MRGNNIKFSWEHTYLELDARLYSRTFSLCVSICIFFDTLPFLPWYVTLLPDSTLEVCSTTT